MTKEFTDGDRVGHEATTEISQYDLVMLTGERQVGRTDSADDQIWGVAQNSAEVGDDITVIQRGEYTANISDAVAVNEDIAPSGGTPGQGRTLDTGGGDAEQQKIVKAVEDLPEENRMLVFLG